MAAKETELETTNSLLFPEFSMASWPEVGDFSIPATVQQVLGAAQENGLPDDVESWKHRDTRIAWRGAAKDPIRKKMVALSKANPDRMDVSPIQYQTQESDETVQDIVSSNKLTRWGHCKYRFLLHLNGIHNNRYSAGSKWKLLCGSLIFVLSEPMFVEWWEADSFTAYEHYVPFSNGTHLLQQLAYYSNHLDEAARIAKNGMELAKRAFDSRDDFMVEALTLYAKATHNLTQPKCVKHASSLPEAKSFTELQELYGPRVCV